MDHDEHLMLLGKVAANAQVLEAVVALVVGEALGLDEATARLVTGRLTMTKALDLLGDLHKRPGGRPGSPGVDEWRKHARKAFELRNTVLHSTWYVASDDSVAGYVRREVAHPDDGDFAKAAVKALLDAIKSAPIPPGTIGGPDDQFS